jgi:AcrR family transcriptional regulator
MVTMTAVPEERETRGLRERKKLRTQREIERVALDLFLRQGFEATTLDEIAAAADISKRTFFRYFSGKADVAFSTSSGVPSWLASHIDAASADESPFEATRQTLLQLAMRYDDDAEAAIAMSRLIRREPRLVAYHLQERAEWERCVQAALASRYKLDEAQSSLVAGVCVAIFKSAYEMWLTRGDALLVELVKDQFALFETVKAPAERARPRRR